MDGQDGRSVVRELEGLGFSPLEAEVYANLSAAPTPMTGYEIAKQLGASRSNVYAALHQLEQQGIVLREPVAVGGARYRAAPFQDVADRALRTLELRVRRLAALLRPTPPSSGIWVAHGDDAFRREARALIGTASATLDVGAEPRHLRDLGTVLVSARERVPDRHYACWDGCGPRGCGICEDPVYRPSDSLHLAGAAAVIADASRAVVAVRQGATTLVVVHDLAPLIAGHLASIRGPEGRRDGVTPSELNRRVAHATERSAP